MNLESITQSEVGQKEKDKYHILTHVYGIQKNGTEEFIYRAAMEKQTQRIDLIDLGRGEERVRCMKRVTWKLTLPYVKQIANHLFAVWLRKLKQGLCINLERWDGEGVGSEVQEGGDICTPMADSC